MDHEGWPERQHAASALGDIAEHSAKTDDLELAVAPLLEATKDDEESVRQLASRALELIDLNKPE